jgi:polar amino acid transport system substrate-binding protein
MKCVKKSGVVLGLVLLCSSLLAETKTITMGIYDWEPYVSKKQENHGLLSEIIDVALERMGYTVVIKVIPFARIIEDLKTGNIDISPAISQNDERSKNIYFTSPVYDLSMGFIYKKGKINYNNIDDLKEYKGGIMAGTFWAQELEAAGIRYEEVTEQEQNMKKLISGRVDFVCMPKEIAFYLIKTLGEDPSDYDFKLFRMDGQPAGISRKTKSKELPDDFEKGMGIIRNDGTYDKIIAKYK